VLVILRATAPPDPDAFTAAARSALAALATRPGYLRGHVGRAVDDPDRWVVTCEWADVGSGRRGLTSGAVRTEIMPLMAYVENEPNAYEVLD
jgi:heme-degrading monooxygenase HmoA